jgi:hypothetical protein
MSARGWTDGGVDVQMGRGNFDTSLCAGVPDELVEARAAAIVPGFVYGLRIQTPPTPIEPGQEQLVVFLPRGQLVSAGGDPSFPLGTTNTGPFTRLTFPLDPDTAASASVRLGPSSLDLWTKLRSTGRPVWSFTDADAVARDALLGIDVASEGKTRLGSVFLSIPPTSGSLYARLVDAIDQAKSPPASRSATALR